MSLCALQRIRDVNIRNTDYQIFIIIFSNWLKERFD